MNLERAEQRLRLRPAIRTQTAIFLLTGVLLLAAALPAAGQQPSAPEADPADVASIDAIIEALYDVISGPAGQPRDWDRMRSLFVPDARLIPTGVGAQGVVYRAQTLQGWIDGADQFFSQNNFWEKEIARTAQRFGNVAHAFSTYISVNEEGAEPFARGINSIQMLNDGERWWIMTIFWDSERPDNPIPDRYLP